MIYSRFLNIETFINVISKNKEMDVINDGIKDIVEHPKEKKVFNSKFYKPFLDHF